MDFETKYEKLLEGETVRFTYDEYCKLTYIMDNELEGLILIEVEAGLFKLGDEDSIYCSSCGNYVSKKKVTSGNHGYVCNNCKTRGIARL